MPLFLKKVLSVCSGDISSCKGHKLPSGFHNYTLIDDLMTLLNNRNGFYGFESALHVFPFETVGEEIGVVAWNDNRLWIDCYDDFARNAIFFAEDVFGGQFCIKQDGIYTFDPETGSFDYLAPDINEWCKKILEDYEVLTGFPLANAWQKKHGPIPVGYRLVPKVPFVAGGEYEPDNLYLEKSTVAMKARANIALQIRDVPDGSNIQLRLIDKD
ncbi:SMI1/KNR4 family protein [Leclercia sp.]|uniref:SMI1/KNR4 family protein n=1 Tax=Leclercia sp. TaxID=1898428 RepID=UPI00289F6E6E|nr:SMI1/KNR4 family protein [Leclercia sp.]